MCLEEPEPTSSESDSDLDSGESGDGDGDSGDGDGDSGDGDGDDDSGDGDGDGDGDEGNCEAGETWCDGICVDTSIDLEHCGSCGHACEVVDGNGACSEGVCAPTLGNCVATGEPLVSCSEACAAQGKVCAAGGCGGRTLTWHGNLDSCNSFIGSAGGGPCSLPTEPVTNYYRCCCGEQ
ncbi:Endo-1,4-beta-xylanase A precursor [Enhygromyxa salina]|uniref:Endo-1,4-beta-xylanase A n=1 Tax=Enhygromyxa salina TaxID=215803 RepID=A0A0C2A3E4_9BACT|nr:Endo-1,4-beta-xylanase A precursor [Enhygromyxa salina]